MTAKKLFTKENITSEREAELLYELKCLNRELELAYRNFENQTDADLLNASIFRLNEVSARYSYAVKKAKEYGIKSNYFRFEENHGLTCV